MSDVGHDVLFGGYSIQSCRILHVLKAVAQDHMHLCALVMQEGSAGKRASEAVAALFGNGPPPKQSKLSFAKISEEEYQLKSQAEMYEETARKLKDQSGLASKDALRKKLADEWGLQLPRPPPRQSKGGPKPKAERWKQGLYDFLEAVVHGKAAAPAIPPPLSAPTSWDPKTMTPDMYMATAKPPPLEPADLAEDSAMSSQMVPAPLPDTIKSSETVEKKKKQEHKKRPRMCFVFLHLVGEQCQ